MPQQKNYYSSQNNYYQPEKQFEKGISKTDYANNVWVKSQYPQELQQPHSTHTQQASGFNQKR